LPGMVAKPSKLSSQGFFCAFAQKMVLRGFYFYS